MILVCAIFIVYDIIARVSKSKRKYASPIKKIMIFTLLIIHLRINTKNYILNSDGLVIRLKFYNVGEIF